MLPRYHRHSCLCPKGIIDIPVCAPKGITDIFISGAILPYFIASRRSIPYLVFFQTSYRNRHPVSKFVLRTNGIDAWSMGPKRGHTMSRIIQRNFSQLYSALHSSPCPMPYALTENYHQRQHDFKDQSRKAGSCPSSKGLGPRRARRSASPPIVECGMLDVAEGCSVASQKQRKIRVCNGRGALLLAAESQHYIELRSIKRMPVINFRSA